MLSELYIENIAVIKQVGIQLGTGLNVFTGETGAGKTVLLSAVSAVLGGRISKDMIRSGEKRAVVSAVFTGLTEENRAHLESLGYAAEDGQVLISRELDLEGRGNSRINGRPASLSVLRQAAGMLIGIHGQHDSQELTVPERHLGFVDSYGRLSGELEQYRQAYENYCARKTELEKSRMDESERLQRIDLLRYQQDEIEAASLTEGEEETLTAQRDLIRNAEKITAVLNSIYTLLEGDDEQAGTLGNLSRLTDEIGNVARFVPELGSYESGVSEAYYHLQELGSAVRDTMEGMEFDPRQLDEMESRLEQIRRLERKYGGSIGEILNHLEKVKNELWKLENSAAETSRLESETAELRLKAEKLAEALSERRRQSGKELIERVEQELAFLDMPNVRLVLDWGRKELSGTGCDALEFLISANPGEEPKPLSRIASGGELSRIMLALKNVLADKDGVSAVIFDEIDAGVSGRAAQRIGQKLKEVSRHRQVLCVTHLAQVAAFGDRHFRIEKTVEEGRTFSRVRELSREERIRELARITVGENITETAWKGAEEMLARCAG